jgi:cell division protease FtsH
MKYETIDSDQIDALMEGREVPKPKDWADLGDDDAGTPGVSASADESADEKDTGKDGTIGGPAGQH